MLALLGAMREEVAELKKRISVEEALAEPGCRIYRGRYRETSVLLVQTGMGREMAERATNLVLERFPVAAVVSFGIAGGLDESVRAGDVVLCSPLYCGDGPIPTDPGTSVPCYADGELVSLAERSLEGKGIRWTQGASVTVSRVVSNPKAKYDLGKAFSAVAVDMESYWIARIAADRRVPFLAIRTASDAVGDTLPPFEKFVNLDGSLRRRKAMLHFVSHPQDLVRLLRLYRKTSVATRNLTAAIDCLITGLAGQV